MDGDMVPKLDGDAAPTQQTTRGVQGGEPAPRPMGSDRRAQIIAATTRLIARDGVAAVSTRKIAREADVNLATLHYLFPGKDGILSTVLEHVTDAMIGAVSADVQLWSGLRAALTESVAAARALLDREPALPLVRCDVLLYAGRRPELAPAAYQQQRRFIDALLACYRAASVRDESCAIPLDELAALVGSGIDGLAMRKAVGAPPREIASISAHLLQLLLALVQPTEAPKPQHAPAWSATPGALSAQPAEARRSRASTPEPAMPTTGEPASHPRTTSGVAARSRAGARGGVARPAPVGRCL